MDSDNSGFGSNSIPGCLLARGSRCALCIGKYYFLVLIEKAQKGLYKRLNVPYSLYIRKREREASSPPVQLEFGIGEEFLLWNLRCVFSSPFPSSLSESGGLPEKETRHDKKKRSVVFPLSRR